MGATGILNALDARSGAVVWSRNAASDAGIKVPQWGFAGSPLVVDDMVVAAVAGRLAAYDLATGNPRWFGPDGGGGYGSPHLLTIGGVEQKVIGARQAGIEVMLVPAGDNAKEARRYADGMKIYAVKSFQQALRVLATLPPHE